MTRIVNSTLEDRRAFVAEVGEDLNFLKFNPTNRKLLDNSQGRRMYTQTHRDQTTTNRS